MSELSARVRIPERARRGEVVEIRTLASHPMETGFRLDTDGHRVPRNLIDRVTCRYAGRTVFDATLRPAIAANPYLSFRFVADVSGEVELTWHEDTGATLTERGHLEVEDP
ncbi:MAG: thiosulfate oxidation carrier complex protein SoxZ [Pseudomonadales bacterium]|jgi:sulfur-oxidizing protein SoxZ|nr:thiosulfate oxidation carrier complex protein SoxZ [Pseudomonadales bacterium]